MWRRGVWGECPEVTVSAETKYDTQSLGLW